MRVVKQAESLKNELQMELMQQTSKIHLCLNGWTSTNQYSFIAITAHYINSNWELKEKLLSLQETTDHSGVGVAEVVKNVLDDYGLQNKLGCITMDNTSANDSMATALGGMLDDNSMI